MELKDLRGKMTVSELLATMENMRETIQRLQQENERLREQLDQSITDRFGYKEKAEKLEKENSLLRFVYK